MPKLTLHFGDQVLKEVPIGPHGVRIGRLPDNAIMIDNPAVSSHHLKVFPDGDQFIAEDLGSTNGTYIKETRITRQTLAHGDELLVGKHKIVFDKFAGDAPAAVADQPEPAASDLDGGTVYLDTKQQRALIAKLNAQEAAEKTAVGHGSPTAAKPAPARVGILYVVSGRADKREYKLDAHTSLIGKANTSVVRLHGWFKPNVALSISRKGESYGATRLGGRPRINNQPLSGRVDLKDGDVIQVSGLSLKFRLK